MKYGESAFIIRPAIKRQGSFATKKRLSVLCIILLFLTALPAFAQEAAGSPARTDYHGRRVGIGTGTGSEAPALQSSDPRCRGSAVPAARKAEAGDPKAEADPFAQLTGRRKATAIVGYIAVQDLTKMGDIVRSRTYEAFFPLIAVTAIYFVLEGLLSFARRQPHPYQHRSQEAQA